MMCLAGKMYRGYHIRLDSKTRVKVLETQIVAARLADLRHDSTYDNLLRHYQSLLRDSLNITRYILKREDNSELEEISKLLRIDNALKTFTVNALDIINRKKVK